MGTILGLVLFSAILFFGFVLLGIFRTGLLPSYSAYSEYWEKAVPMNNMNMWSIITIAAAFLICPGLLELGVASVWQFLGFLVPVYLIMVALTPDWYKDKKQYLWHCIAAALCATGAFLWCLLVMHAGRILIGVGVFIITLVLLTGTLKESYVFWLEMFMFISVYLITILSLLALL